MYIGVNCQNFTSFAFNSRQQKCELPRSLGSLENRLGGRAHGFEPAADVHLGVGFSTEMPGGRTVGCNQVPLNDRQFLISAFDYKPMNRMLTDNPANLALEFLQTRHAFSVERWLGKG
jgi:hypothetical protein